MDRKCVSIVFVDDVASCYAGGSKLRAGDRCSVLSLLKTLKELPLRFAASLVPPLTKRCSYVHVDYLGPIISVAVLAALLQYGHLSKMPSAVVDVSPGVALLAYLVACWTWSYCLTRVVAARITGRQLLSLLGYGLSGHVLTLAVSVLFHHDVSNAVFFCCLTVFGGLCALRVALVLLVVIPVPAARLIVCSTVAMLQLLSIVFMHFAYMHRTFVYGTAKARGSR